MEKCDTARRLWWLMSAIQFLWAALGAVERNRERCDQKVRQNVRETGFRGYASG